MSCVVQWWDVLFVKGMHFSSKNARLLNFKRAILGLFFFIFVFSIGLTINHFQFCR